MADFKIAKIRYTWKGTWSATTQYVRDDIIHYGGKSYVCFATHIASSAFLADLTATTPCWVLMFDGGMWRGAWSTTTLYNPGDIVRYGGIVYKAITSHTSSATSTLGLEANQTAWTILAKTENWKNLWSVATQYKINDIVKYGPQVYRCVTAHISASSSSDGLEFDIAKWELVYQQISYKGNWSASTIYNVNDIIKFGGSLWKCNTFHTSIAVFEVYKFDIYLDGLQFESAPWSNTQPYQKGDIAGYGGYVYKALQTHTGQTPQITATAYWSLVTQNYRFLGNWSATGLTIFDPLTYKVGDVVRVNGYVYLAILNSTNIEPPNPTYWRVLNQGNAWRGLWRLTDPDPVLLGLTIPVNFKLGDLATFGSSNFECILAHTASLTKTPTRGTGAIFTVVKDGSSVYTSVTATTAGADYAVYDVFTILGTSLNGTSPANDVVVTVTAINGSGGITNVTFTGTGTGGGGSTAGLTGKYYWRTKLEGAITNVLSNQGDISWYNAGAKSRLPVGTDGQLLRVNGTNLTYKSWGVIPKVYYVAPTGTDAVLLGYGVSLDKPFQTVAYACANVVGPATIFIKTGIYSEVLPITIPADVALVGDELRSTVIQPASGFITSNMFYVRNGSGIRNMTLQGLNGTLGAFNAYITKRPTAGAYVSLDPQGFSNISAQISNKSPYIQNVTTIGTGCVGLKVDGALHGGGNKSIVANDFTQVISDGIGVWITNRGKAELVSVFTYYCHIGYLAENGGKIRATNGNNSYGDYGAVSEGSNADEVPITGTVNNRSQQASVGSVLTNGQQILALEYTNAGQNYNTSAAYSFGGSGSGAAVSAATVTDGGIFEIRLQDPLNGDSAGGSGFINVQTYAQAGETTGTITLSAGDSNVQSNYLGMRVVIISGKGAGQYGYVQAYNPTTKIATIYKETNNTQGWDHLLPGSALFTLDTTSQYSIEPRVVIAAPSSGTRAIARVFVSGGRIGSFRIINPGSGYSLVTPPVVTLTSPGQSTATYTVRVGNGVLGQPTFNNSGVGYLTATATVSGIGYSDSFQYGAYLYVSGLSSLPGPGANIQISGVTTVFRLVTVSQSSGSGPYSCRLQLNPALELKDASAHATAIQIRSDYSQNRLTGHDWLEIGTGNFSTTNYPNQDITTIRSGNLAVEAGGGRVFYTATDQDGNYRVGNLFKVEQASGIATLNASFFDLNGLTQLTLGGIVLGGTSATVTEISTDSTLPANSDNIIVTQRALRNYISSRIGGGGATINANTVVSGQISLSQTTVNNVVSTNISNTDPTLSIKFATKVNFTGGVSGSMLASSYFISQMR